MALVFTDKINNIDVYNTVRYTKAIRVHFKYGKVIITSPYKLSLREIKAIYDKYQDTALKYSKKDIYLLTYKGKKYYIELYKSTDYKIIVNTDSIEVYTNNISEEKLIKLLKDFLVKEIEYEINLIKEELIKKLTKIFKYNFNKIELSYKYSKTYLGMNNKKGITISGLLAKYPPIFYPYILAHEYIHEFVFNHSKEFYDTLFEVFPEYSHILKEMRTYTKIMFDDLF